MQQKQSFSVKMLLRKGNAAFKKNLFDDSTNYFRQVLDKQSDNINALFSLGLINFKRRNYKDANLRFNSVINIDPNNEQAYYFSAITNLEEGILNQALIDIDKAIILDPKNPEYYHAKAKILHYSIENNSIPNNDENKEIITKNLNLANEYGYNDKQKEKNASEIKTISSEVNKKIFFGLTWSLSGIIVAFLIVGFFTGFLGEAKLKVRIGHLILFFAFPVIGLKFGISQLSKAFKIKKQVRIFKNNIKTGDL